jgi:hypothetical protein
VYTLAAPGLTITSPEVEDSFATNFGPGAGLMIGYALTPTISSFAELDLAKQGSSSPEFPGTFGLVHFEVGARAKLPLGTATTTPYAMASVGRRAIGARVYNPEDREQSATISFSGMMFGLGGGIEHVLSPHTTLDAGLELGFGKFGQASFGGESGPIPVNNTMSTRFRVGVNWRP